jgi:hypothetical protein
VKNCIAMHADGGLWHKAAGHQPKSVTCDMLCVFFSFTVVSAEQAQHHIAPLRGALQEFKKLTEVVTGCGTFTTGNRFMIFSLALRGPPKSKKKAARTKAQKKLVTT